MEHQNRAGDGAAVVEDADRRGVEREAVDEVGGAVDGVDDPDELVVGIGVGVDLLADDAVGGEALRDALAEEALDGVVDLADGVARGVAVVAVVLVLDGDLVLERSDDALTGEARELERDTLDLDDLRFRGQGRAGWRGSGRLGRVGGVRHGAR